MKRNSINIILILMSLVLFSSVCLAGEGSNASSPVAFLPSDTYNFEPVLEGVVVTHDFIIENKGKAPLQVLNVIPGCGCTTASYTKEVPPGGSGKISFNFNSAGYGGNTVTKRPRVETNDPDHEILYLTITGAVEAIARIEPPNSILTGTAGADINAEIRITPNKKSPFKITEAKAKEGKNIRFDLKELKVSDGSQYVLTVFNLRKEAAKYNDSIYLTTDNASKPEIKINVAAEIR